MASALGVGSSPATCRQMQAKTQYNLYVECKSRTPGVGSYITNYSARSIDEAGMYAYNALKSRMNKSTMSLDEKNIQVNGSRMIVLSKVIEDTTDYEEALDNRLTLTYHVEIPDTDIKYVHIVIRQDDPSEEYLDDHDPDEAIQDIHDAYYRHGELGARSWKSGHYKK